MRAIVLLFLVTPVLAACGDTAHAPAQPSAAAGPAPARLDFPAKTRIPVRLDMRASTEGGRAFGLPRGWRGEVAFAGREGTSRCSVRAADAGPIEPGGSYRTQLVCGDAVRLAADGGRGFRVIEDGREIASGEVLD